MKLIDIPVYFLQEKHENGLFIPEDEKYVIMTADIYTKTCSGPIISCSTKLITEFQFYPSSGV